MTTNLTKIEFAGPPIADEIGPSQFGLNKKWFDELCVPPNGLRPAWTDLVTNMILNPTPKGVTMDNKTLAEMADVALDTARRFKKRLEETGAIYMVNLNGRYAYSPDLLLMKDQNGKVISHASFLELLQKIG